MANTLKLFISYCSEDSEAFPLLLKDYFECSNGFDVFLASKSLDMGDDFKQEILSNLAVSDLFIPLFSRNFLNSIYANQEVGIAIEKRLKIMPVSIDGTNPRGFIDHLHAHHASNLDETEAIRIVSRVFSNLIRNPKYSQFHEKTIDSLSASFLKCNHFKKTSLALEFMKIALQNGFRFNPIHLSVIKKGIEENSQVKNAEYLMPNIKQFLRDAYDLVIDI